MTLEPRDPAATPSVVPSTAPLDLSIASVEFSRAQERIRGLLLDDTRRPPRLRYQPPTRDAVGPGSLRGIIRSAGGPILDALEAQQAGTISARALVEEALEAVARRDGELHAIVELCAERARAEADDQDRARKFGDPVLPLQGVPVTVKDVIDVGGLPTRGGSAAYHDVPAVDAVSVARLRAAGAIVIAKTSTHEFALGVTNPQSRNPHDPTRIPGGSSGGSAIAVATGMGLASLGTDTRASIRVPASLSGAVGFKPTFGQVPTEGVVSLSWTMDHVGPLARTVGDAARVLAVLTGAGPGRLDDPLADGVSGELSDRLATAAVASLRVGVPSTGFAGADPDVTVAVHDAIARLSASGATVVDMAHPTDDTFDDANALGLLISRVEAATFHRAIGTDLSACWTETAEQLAAGLDILAIDYLTAQRLRAQLADTLLAIFDEVDVLALPTTLVTAPRVDDFARFLMVLSRNVIPFSLVGFPAVSIPCGTDRSGLPIGLQLVAAPGREDLLVLTGAAYERLRP